jgi:transcriptional regulator with PAS, ATPase and Fis domain
MAMLAQKWSLLVVSEKEVIRHTLTYAKTRTEAAKLLRIGRRTLQRKLKGYDLA